MYSMSYICTSSVGVEANIDISEATTSVGDIDSEQTCCVRYKVPSIQHQLSIRTPALIEALSYL